jgi:hypothetical protein
MATYRNHPNGGPLNKRRGAFRKIPGKKACLPGRRPFAQLIAAKQLKQAARPGAKHYS